MTPRAKCLALAGAAFAFALAAWPELGEAAFVRANCRGIQELSTSKSLVRCEESSVLEDGERLMLGHTRAAASLDEARLSSSASGGQMRGVGSNGGEAGAVLKDRLTITGDWEGTLAVTVRLCVAYTFAGFGDSRVHAVLRTSSGGTLGYASQARVRLSHRGFGGASLENVESHGVFAIPRPGRRPSRSVFELSVTERIRHDNPVLSLRADLATYALPNLEPLDPVMSSFAEAEAWLAVSIPPSLGLLSQSGAFLRASQGRGVAESTPAGHASWGIIAASSTGSEHALRDHRRRYRVAARPDCRQQLGVDG